MAYLYNLSWIADDEYRHIIADDLSEASTCYKVRAFKAVNILLGSAIEAALLYAVQQAHIKIPSFVTLNQLLQLARENKLLNKSNIYFGHALRECRNLVHPSKCLSEGYKVDKKKADLLFQICSQILQELQKNIGVRQLDSERKK